MVILTKMVMLVTVLMVVMVIIVFFFLIVFGVLYKYSSAAPQRTAYSKVPSQMAAHLRTGSPL